MDKEKEKSYTNFSSKTSRTIEVMVLAVSDSDPFTFLMLSSVLT